MILKPKPFRKLRYGPHWSKTGLVGLWLMNEGSGDRIFDLSGNGNMGTFTGDTNWVAGRLGSAVNIPGTNDDIVLTDLAYHDQLINNFTMVAGVNSATFQDRATIVQLEVNFWWRIENATNKNQLAMQGGVITADTGMIAGIYYDLAITWNGTKHTFYQDGQVDGSGASGFTLDTPNTFRIGSQGGTLREFNGNIEYLYIYNRELSASEIGQLKTNPFIMFDRDEIELWAAATQGVAVGTILPQITSAYMRI